MILSRLIKDIKEGLEKGNVTANQIEDDFNKSIELARHYESLDQLPKL